MLQKAYLNNDEGFYVHAPKQSGNVKAQLGYIGRYIRRPVRVDFKSMSLSSSSANVGSFSPVVQVHFTFNKVANFRKISISPIYKRKTEKLWKQRGIHEGSYPNIVRYSDCQ